LIDNWPTVKYENDEITNQIKEIFEDYTSKIIGKELSPIFPLVIEENGAPPTNKKEKLLNGNTQ